MKPKIFIILLIISTITLSCKHKNQVYKDGVYEGESQSIYTSENFYGISTVEIKNDKIVTINFKIVDKSNNELFDGNYEKHYTDNQEYAEQCRKDWDGVKTYPKRLLGTQNLDKIDAVSGATWSCNMFKSSVSVALDKAKMSKN